MLTCPGDNVAANPDIAVGAAGTRILQIGSTGEWATVAAGDMVAGERYLLELVSVEGVLHWGIRWTSNDTKRVAALEAEATQLRSELDSTPYVLYQTEANPPERPNTALGRMVLWVGPTDPSANMDGVDLWIETPAHTVPDIILDSSWALYDKRDGDGIVLRYIGDLPNEMPPITDTEAVVNGSIVHAGFDTTEDFFIGGLTNGETYSVQLRHVNYVGSGQMSVAKSVTLTNGDFVDTFGYTGIENGKWNVLETAAGVDVASGVMTFDKTNHGSIVVEPDAYFPPNQFVELDVTSATASTSADRGLSVIMRSDTDGAGYGLRISEGAWKFGIFEGSSYDMVSVEGSGAVALPATFKIECSGDTMTAYINSVQVAQFTDDTYDRGAIRLRVRSTTDDYDIVIDNFTAGDL